MKYKLFFFLALFFGSALGVYAENKNIVDLGEIVVTPSGIEEDPTDSPREVNVISGGGGSLNNVRDLGEPLSREASVNISSYGGIGAAQNIRMRGSTSAQVLVMMDGRPVNNPRDGSVDLNTLPLDNVSRVELVPGPSSSLYGSQAMAGTLNVITKDPPQGKMETEVYSSFGTFRTSKEYISHGARMGNFAYRVSGGWKDTQGYRANGKHRSENYENKFEYKINDQNSLTLNAGFYHAESGVPGGISAPDYDDRETNLTHFTDAAWKYTPDTLTTIVLKSYGNYDRLELDENTAGSTIRSAHTTRWRGLNLQADRKLFDAWQVIAGLNYTGNFNNSNFSGKHKYYTRAVYLENKLDLTKRLRVELGARVDDYSNFGTQINPSFNFLYKFTPDFKMHGLLARSFRTPTFNDLYWPDEGWAKGNPDLNPEKGITGEIGLDNKFGRWFSIGVTYYRNAFSNLIQWAQADAGDPGSIWRPSNVGSAIVNGVELNDRVFLTDAITASMGYTYLRAVDKKSGKFLVYQPQNKYDFGLEYKDTDGLAIKWRAQVYGSRFADSTNTLKMKPFFTMGFDLSKKFNSGITAFCNIENLGNKKFQVIHDYPMPGFSLTSGVKVEF